MKVQAYLSISKKLTINSVILSFHLNIPIAYDFYGQLYLS